MRAMSERLEDSRPALLLSAALTLAVVLAGDAHDDGFALLEFSAGNFSDASVRESRGDFPRNRGSIDQHVDSTLDHHWTCDILTVGIAILLETPAPALATLAGARLHRAGGRR